MVLYGGMSCGRGTLAPDDEATEAAFLAMIRAGWARPDTLFRRVFTTAFIPDATEQQMEWMDELQRTSTNTDNAVRSRIARHQIDVTPVLPEIAAYRPWSCTRAATGSPPTPGPRSPPRSRTPGW